MSNFFPALRVNTKQNDGKQNLEKDLGQKQCGYTKILEFVTRGINQYQKRSKVVSGVESFKLTYSGRLWA